MQEGGCAEEGWERELSKSESGGERRREGCKNEKRGTGEFVRRV